MRIMILGKYPPIEGGVSVSIYHAAQALATRGHEVLVVTNSGEVEPGFRQFLWGYDLTRIEAAPGPGRVEVHTTSPLPMDSYIPWTPPFLSELFGRALALIDDWKVDLIFGSYFEPYGLAAALVSKATGIPLALRHAGSDIARLARHRDLAHSYRWMLCEAASVITTRNSIRDLEELSGSKQSKATIRLLSPAALPRDFSDRGAKLDLNELLDELERWHDFVPVPEETRNAIRAINHQRKGLVWPIIGTYGKVGATKGSFLLLDSSFHEKLYNRCSAHSTPVAPAAPLRHRAFLASAPAAGVPLDPR